MFLFILFSNSDNTFDLNFVNLLSINYLQNFDNFYYSIKTLSTSNESGTQQKNGKTKIF